MGCSVMLWTCENGKPHNPATVMTHYSVSLQIRSHHFLQELLQAVFILNNEFKTDIGEKVLVRYFSHPRTLYKHSSVVHCCVLSVNQFKKKRKRWD